MWKVNTRKCSWTDAHAPPMRAQRQNFKMYKNCTRRFSSKFKNTINFAKSNMLLTGVEMNSCFRCFPTTNTNFKRTGAGARTGCSWWRSGSSPGWGGHWVAWLPGNGTLGAAAWTCRRRGCGGRWRRGSRGFPRRKPRRRPGPQSGPASWTREVKKGLCWSVSRGLPSSGTKRPRPACCGRWPSRADWLPSAGYSPGSWLWKSAGLTGSFWLATVGLRTAGLPRRLPAPFRPSSPFACGPRSLQLDGGPALTFRGGGCGGAGTGESWGRRTCPWPWPAPWVSSWAGTCSPGASSCAAPSSVWPRRWRDVSPCRSAVSKKRPASLKFPSCAFWGCPEPSCAAAPATTPWTRSSASSRGPECRSGFSRKWPARPPGSGPSRRSPKPRGWRRRRPFAARFPLVQTSWVRRRDWFFLLEVGERRSRLLAFERWLCRHKRGSCCRRRAVSGSSGLACVRWGDFLFIYSRFVNAFVFWKKIAKR